MNSPRPRQEESVVCLADLWDLMRRYRKAIQRGALVVACLGAFHALTRPVSYEFESSFRQRENGDSGVAPSSMMDYLRVGPSHGLDSKAASLMKSRLLMEQVARTHHLQAVVTGEGQTPGLLRQIGRNLLVEWAYWKGRDAPLFDEPFSSSLVCQDIVYEGEVAVSLQVHPLSSEQYEIVTSSGTKVGTGRFGQPFSHSTYRFTLSWQGAKDPLLSRSYGLTLLPLPRVADALVSSMEIDADADDKNLLCLKLCYGDRQRGATILNGIMTSYQEMVKQESDVKAQTQVAYLNRRQEETSKALDEVVTGYAKKCAEGITSTGFVDSEKQMEFLGRSQQEYQQRLISIGLELRRLEHLKAEREVALYDRYTATGDSEIINTVLGQIRTLKQQRATLDLALRRESANDPDNTQRVFADQIAQLQEIQSNIREVSSLLHRLTEEQDFSFPLLQEDRFSIGLWAKRLEQGRQDWLHAAPEAERDKQSAWQTQRDNFLSYLKNLLRVLTTQETLVKERMAYQQRPHEEFEGIDLATANQLYFAYQKQLDDLQARERQNAFALEQLKTPHLDLSSLSEVVVDAMSREIVAAAGHTLLALQDDNNRSEREQERLKGELEVKQQFLVTHLQQLRQLDSLNEQVIFDKIKTLQSVNLDLINQQISILEKQLIDYLTTRIDNLAQEREVIRQHLAELHQSMACLPGKWVAEKRLAQDLESSQRIMQEVTRLVESKIISHNLEVIQSSPVDVAMPPLLPKRPGLIKWVFTGGILGACMVGFFAFAKALATGLNASRANIEMLGGYVVGRLSKRSHESATSKLLDEDLETLRRLVGRLALSKRQERGKILLVVQGKGPDYGHHLATLVAKQGLKVLRLAFSLDRAADVESLPGLLQFLEGTAERPHISRAGEKDYDEVAAGGLVRFDAELLASERCRHWLHEMVRRYDLILAVSHAAPFGAETEGNSLCVDHVVLSLSDERLEEARDFIRRQPSLDSFSFVFTEPQSLSSPWTTHNGNGSL